MDVENKRAIATHLSDVTSDSENKINSDSMYNGAVMEMKLHPHSEISASTQSHKQADERDAASISQVTLNNRGSVNESVNTLSSNYQSQRTNPDLAVNLQENGNNLMNSKANSVYDFNDSGSGSVESPNDLPLVMDDGRLSTEKECNQVQNKAIESSNINQAVNQSNQISPHMTSSHNQSYQQQPLSYSQNINQQISNLQSQRLNALASQLGNQSLPASLSGQSFNNSINSSFEDSLSLVSEYASQGENCFDGLIRRGRGRPRGSKNGTGLGRTRGRGYKYMKLSEDASNMSYEVRNLNDPYSSHKRGRPRSRFIVDLGEQNHEAWTKSRDKLKISDAELTTLLLSLYESRNEGKEFEDSNILLSLTSSELKKWKEKFGSQIALLTHYASIHNTTCCTCLGLKKKKYIPTGTGTRGRPRKYPPPVGYGPGMQRPDTIDEDGNIFEPQIILKDGTMVKNEPLEEKLVGTSNNASNSTELPTDQQPNRSDSNMSAMSINSDPFSMLNRPLTQDELEKRKEYYSNHKNKVKYVCHSCQVHFYHKPNFDYHMSKLEATGKCKTIDRVNNLYLCDTCGEGFSWREKLEKHLRLAEQHGTHNQKELLMYGDFQCAMCGKTFNKRTTYLHHVKWHEEREDIPCVICGTMFKQTELRHHLMEVHSNDSLPCSYCGKLFTSRKYLEKHEMIHQGGNFPCPECGKIFTLKSTMQAHLRGHAFEKEYPCESCGQMYNQRIGLCIHLKKHFSPSEFSLECDICAHYFASDDLLKYHKKKIHNIPIDDISDELSDQGEYLSSPVSSQTSGDDEREKTAFGGLSNAAVKNMIGSLGMSLGASVNLTMKGDIGDNLEEGQVSLRNTIHMNEPNRHMSDQREATNHLKDSLDQENSMRLGSAHQHLGLQQPVRGGGTDEHLHLPQDLTRMASATQAHMNDATGSAGGRLSSAPQAHMNDIRSSLTESPGVRSSDASAHVMDNLGRMAVENFGRMAAGNAGGYLAEHLRRMAENQSRMSDSISHYDDRENYSRLGDNLRSMSRNSAGDGRLGDNLSHMGVIRPQSSTSSQWPAHMQNHSSLDGMNQSSQSSQHALYPLPFWPYDPSLRQYHH